jgi:hypothetical protein
MTLKNAVGHLGISFSGIPCYAYAEAAMRNLMQDLSVASWPILMDTEVSVDRGDFSGYLMTRI